MPPVRRISLKRKVITLLSGCIVLFLTLAGVITINGMNDRLGHADVALVLGNKVYPNGNPAPRLEARLDRAVALYELGCYPKIIVSGGTGKEGVPEGTAMKKYLVTAGIPPDDVIVDDNGVDTYSSALNTKVIMEQHGFSDLLVITQFFHIPRSRLALSKCGVSAPYHSHSRSYGMRDIYSTLREVPAFAKYMMIRGRAL